MYPSQDSNETAVELRKSRLHQAFSLTFVPGLLVPPYAGFPRGQKFLYLRRSVIIIIMIFHVLTHCVFRVRLLTEWTIILGRLVCRQLWVNLHKANPIRLCPLALRWLSRGTSSTYDGSRGGSPVVSMGLDCLRRWLGFLSSRPPICGDSSPR
jgi:hypothetical protein